MFDLSNKQKRNLKKILPFGFIWAFYALVYSLVEKGLLGDSTVYPATGNTYNFYTTLLITFVIGMLMGWVQGYVEVTILKNYFNSFSFSKKVLVKFLIYLLSIISFIVLLTIVSNCIIEKVQPFNIVIYQSLVNFISTFAFWSIVIYVGSIILFTVFIAEISDHLGQGVLMNFVFGKYHKPNEEERIFMFLDMNSSTMIAERLGNIKYFSLLKEYFSDMSNAIVQTKGEVYQYVGDEIVISWEVADGLENANCLKCFFDIKKAIRENKEKYLTEYKFFPTFKAGIHMGRVASGEIGTLKQDILYTGDVLNSTARIQGYCSLMNAEILVSKEVKSKLENYSEFEFQDIGFQSLRGRDKGMQIFVCEKIMSKS